MDTDVALILADRFICLALVSLTVSVCVHSGGVWGWITKQCEARRHLQSRWGSAQTNQVTTGNLHSPILSKGYKVCKIWPETLVIWDIYHQQALIPTSDVLVLSRWHQTCALSCSPRARSNRTPKGSGSSTPGTERTTSSPSSTEPSWSDVHLLLLSVLSTPHRDAAQSGFSVSGYCW